MKKVIKKQIEDFVGLLGQAHMEIRRKIERGLVQEALILLEQCQQSALRLGNLIEEAEGEYFVTVGILEDYCEVIYKIYDGLKQEEDLNVDTINDLLCFHLDKIINSVRNDIEEKLEVVFLPYKASMWDSLESVWKAAVEDPCCDVYVIPIPYYDKNPDGSFREDHYEGNLYPSYVHITSYRAYNFEKRKPDMIFIHNPYDEFNYVTSVHPFFYSKNLKQFTRQLVYIPYFVLGDLNVNNNDALESIAHFCEVPGVVNADKVIVESENMRQAYIEIMVRARGEDTRSYWENKILGLGSPKVDRIFSSDKKKLKIPYTWKRLLEKPDGNWKKVVFYNTCINALLNNSEKTFVKMQEVFRVFKEYQDEIVLLWRPHPLIKATIASMRPEFQKEYEKLVEAYKQQGFGIYDDTADIDRSVALCDGYYGDGSSVMHLCLEATIPVLIQNIGMIRKKGLNKSNNEDKLIDEKYNDIYFRPMGVNIAEEKGKAWMALITKGGICEIDIVTHTAKIRKVFEERSLSKRALYSHLEKVGDKLVFLPDKSAEIAIYDLECDSITYIPLRIPEYEYKECQDNQKFSMALQYKSDVYLFGYSYPAIVKINTISEKAEYITDWLEEVDANIKVGDCYGYFSYGHVIRDNLALIPIGCMNAILELNLETACTRVRKLNVPMKGIYGLSSSDGENIWMVGKGSRTNCLCCWKVSTDDVKEIWLPDVNGELCEPFHAPICTSSKVFLMPMDAACIYEFNIQTGNLRRNKVLEEQAHLANTPVWSWMKTWVPRLEGDWLKFIAGDDLTWQEYNVITGESRGYVISMKKKGETEIEQFFEEAYFEGIEKNMILFEEEVPLEYFLNKILNQKQLDPRKKYKDCPIGKRIYSQLCTI